MSVQKSRQESTNDSAAFWIDLLEIQNVKTLKILAIIGLACSMAVAGFAQKTHPPTATQPGGVKASIFACDKCHVANKVGGKCKGCGGTMHVISAKIGYTCSHCMTSSDKPGNCPKCKMKFEKSAITYACDACHTTALTAAKCSKCKKPMKKTFIKMM